MTDVGVLLRVKTAVAVGVFYVTYVGLYDSKQFDMSVPAIDDANAAEKWAEPGSVVLSQLPGITASKPCSYMNLLRMAIIIR